jgi:hypothetical protein
MKTQMLFLSILLAAFYLTSCNDSTADFEPVFESIEKSLMIDGECTDSVFTSTIDDLTEADIENLHFMREEEKLAHDVYLYFFDLYGERIFSQIAQSEAMHMEAILRLLDHFEIEDLSSTETGRFNNADLQALYDQLILSGEESLEAALAVGALIEETDIADLIESIEETENSDIELVLGKLLNGSYNHLKAFVSVLSANNVSYSPQILMQDDFDAIMAMTNGNNGKGNKQGYKNGNKTNNGEGAQKMKKSNQGKRGGRA